MPVTVILRGGPFDGEIRVLPALEPYYCRMLVDPSTGASMPLTYSPVIGAEGRPTRNADGLLVYHCLA